MKYSDSCIFYIITILCIFRLNLVLELLYGTVVNRESTYGSRDR
jgi:hypothetical protein